MKLYGMCQDWQRKEKDCKLWERPVLGSQAKEQLYPNTSEKLIMSERSLLVSANEQR